MTTTCRTGLTGALELHCAHQVTDAEPRETQYTRTGARYLPTALTFTLTCHMVNGGAYPRYERLKAVAVALGGPRLKKDGTPGQVWATEHFGWENPPAWAQKVIDGELEALRGLRA